MRLKKEGGVTQISLDNAQALIRAHGRPDEIRLRYFEDEWLVEGVWALTRHTFSGFAWGYGGTGPHGLARFFEMIGLPVGVSEIAGWPHEQGRDYRLAASFSGEGKYIETAFEARHPDEVQP